MPTYTAQDGTETTIPDRLARTSDAQRLRALSKALGTPAQEYSVKAIRQMANEWIEDCKRQYKSVMDWCADFEGQVEQKMEDVRTLKEEGQQKGLKLGEIFQTSGSIISASHQLPDGIDTNHAIEDPF